jgi:large subunit ribosomal protein L21e
MRLDNIKLRLMALTCYMPRSHGSRRKARSILTKDNIVRGISYLLHDYKVGEKVVVDVDPREHNTTPHRRFHGRIGVVEGVGRRTLRVSVTIGNKKKILQTRFNHIKPLAGTLGVSSSSSAASSSSSSSLSEAAATTTGAKSK